MIKLIKLMIGAFVFRSICYTRYVYGFRATLELLVVLNVLFILAVFYITEVIESVCCDEEEEDTVELPSDGESLFNIAKVILAICVLSVSSNVFEWITNWCAGILADGADGDIIYD
ncbi:MAG: hypothetical protein IJG59_09815 [Erysipelotrichaceae bacterium]|nr:hypothetical protein [Erysipelotrichaceae bacterium]